MSRIISALLMIVFFGFGCSTASVKDAITFKQPKDLKTSLIIIPGDNPTKAYKLLTDSRPTVLDENKENTIFRTCNAIPAERTETKAIALPAAVFTLFINPIINYFVDEINDNLKKEIEKYVFPYTANTFFPFYTEGATNNFTLTASCFRLTKYIKEGKNSEDVLMDFIGQINRKDQKAFSQIRPLRLYLGQASYEKATPEDKVKISISLKGKALWFNGSIGKKEEIFKLEDLFSTEIYLGSKEPYAKVRYNESLDSWDKYQKLPLPPVSYDLSGHLMEKGKFKSSDLLLEATVAEVGPVPELLSAIVKYFGNQKDDIAKVIVGAAEKYKKEE